jgi:transposase
MVEVLYPRCCGLDVHKKTVVACRITPGPQGQIQKTIRTFGTMTADLLELGDWLAHGGVTQVAMESTGVYWKPIYNLLEEQFDLFLVNAQHIKTVPGRKTDVKDCEWIADLLRHGLLRKSFVPERAGRELRELTRYRSSLVHERSAEMNRLQKTLEGANIKLASVASEVLGVSGRKMLEALLAGTEDPTVLAQFAQKRLREKIPELERALTGRFGAHQRFLVARQVAHIDALDELIEEVSAEIVERLRPFEREIELLDTIPGVGRWSAEVILAEIGPDMRRFPSAGHLASWAGMCPGHHESAGKRQSGKTRKGSKWLRVTLTESAYAAGRGKTYVAAQYHRLLRRRGKKKAAVAVGHTILAIAYHILTTGEPFRDLGADYFVQRDHEAIQRQLIHRLEALGNKVTVEPLVRQPVAA